MIRLLKFAAFLSIVGAVGAAVWVGLYVVNFEPADHAATLKKSPVEIAKENTVDDGQNDTVSPLVSQARQFKLKIDPPPPPRPERREPAQQQVVAEKSADPKPLPEVTTAPPVTRANFKLVGTCRYIEKPQKSLALIDLPAEGHKWVRLGETVRHHVIAEIGDDMIVLDQNGRRTSLYAPKKQEVSLLKNPEPAPTSSVTAKVANAGNSDPITQTSRTGTARSRQRLAARSTPKKVHIPTPEERKENLDTNISQIQNIMQKSAANATPEEKQKEMETWSALLKLLQADRNKVEQNISETPSTPGGDQPETAAGQKN